MKNSIITTLLLITFGSLILPFLASAEETFPTPFPEPTPLVTEDPLVTIRPNRGYSVKKYALLPLEIPAYVMKGISYPIVSLLKVLERKTPIFNLEPRDYIILPFFQTGGGDGTGFGIYFEHGNLFNSGYKLAVDYTLFTDLDQRGGFSLVTPPLYVADRPLFLKMRTRFRINDNARFYGLGPGSLQSNRSEYSFNRVEGGITLDYFLFPSLSLTLPMEVYTGNTGIGENFPSVQNTFPPSELPGFEQRITYLIFGLEFTQDTRDSEVTPSRGAFRSIGYRRYQGLNTQDFNFNEFFLDIRQYFPLWTPRHVFAARNAWVFQTSGGEIPFFLLTDLDWESPLRGFSRGRFRDTSSVLFNFEYRFPVWDYVEGSIFLDTGKVFNGLDDFNFDDWRYSVGGGLNFFMRDRFLFRLQGGYGGEGLNIVFGLSQAI